MGITFSVVSPASLRKSIPSTRRRFPGPRGTTVLKISTNTRPGADDNPWNSAGGVQNESASADLPAFSSCVFRQSVLSKTFQGDRPYISSKLRVCAPRLYFSAYSSNLLLMSGQCTQAVSTKTCSSFLHTRRPSRTTTALPNRRNNGNCSNFYNHLNYCHHHHGDLPCWSQTQAGPKNEEIIVQQDNRTMSKATVARSTQVSVM
jgi:hypothetical protein